jgi:two-component system alkaline phosphatase synthesis response regulator PhoP
LIYCVEDDENIRELVVYTLRNTGFEARGFAGGKEFFAALEESVSSAGRSEGSPPELVLLDIMLPGEDGISILKKLHGHVLPGIPVIMLTAKGTEYDKVRGLEEGADDYISKPFGMMELVARVKAVLRRTKTAEKNEILVNDNVKMDLKAHAVFINDKTLELTLKEFELLRLLMENPGVVLSRDHLLENLWGYESGAETRTVDVHIRTLRQKLEAGGASSAMIETVRGIGYRIAVLSDGKKP